MEHKEIKPTPDRNPAQAELTTTDIAAPSSTINQVLVNITLGLFLILYALYCHLTLSCSWATVGQREITTEPTKTALNWVRPLAIWVRIEILELVSFVSSLRKKCHQR